jgi:ribosomal protein L14
MEWQFVFDDNAAVIINAENNPRGTRVFILLPEKSVTNDLQNYFISKRSSMNKRKIAM